MQTGVAVIAAIPHAPDLVRKQLGWHPQASVKAQMAKNLPTMCETQVRFLGREDPQVKGMATYSSSVLAWTTPWTEEPGRP